MALRPLASITVSFGLVNIPVKLYSATESSGSVSFNLLHAKDGSRLKQQYICAEEEVVVPRDEIIKGYEFAKGEYVTFTSEELKELEEESTQSVEITEFVPLSEVDPVYFDKAYYLGSDRGGEKAYRLLARVMADSGRAALAKYAARGKQYLVLLRSVGERLVMQQLHYADEVRALDEVPVADADLKEQELKLAHQLVDQIARETFNPDAYEDEVKQRVLERIQQKVDGKEIKVAPREEGQGQVIDLMEALRASLAKQPQPPAKKAAPERSATKLQSTDADADEGARRPAKRASGAEAAPATPKRRSHKS